MFSNPLPREEGQAFARVHGLCKETPAASWHLRAAGLSSVRSPRAPHLPLGEGCPLFCVCFVSVRWGRGVGRVVFPPLVGVLWSPAADDELPLTGLDHELLLNCRGAPRGA